MFRESREILSFRAIAILPIVFFAPSVVLALAFPQGKVDATTGILFHVAMIFVVGRLPGPNWAKAAGFGWLTLDILCGALMLNDVPYEIAWPVRLGGHILAGIWLITESVLCTNRTIQVVGIVTGLWLITYTFFGTVLPTAVLGPPSVLTIVWLALLAWKYRPAEEATPALAA
jgi:hypothetical protein